MLSDDSEEGPGGILNTIRARAGVYYEGAEMKTTNWFADGLICPMCNSVWLGIIQAVLYRLSPRLSVLLSLPFALSATTIFIRHKLDS